MLLCMRKFGLATIALAITLIANTFVTVAHADEQIAPLQVTLTITSSDIPLDNPGDLSIQTDSSALVPSPLSQSFSPSPVPEPSTIGLSALGILTLLAFTGAKRRSFLAQQQNLNSMFGSR